MPWLRWSACFVLALGLHAAAVTALLAHWRPTNDAVMSAPTITIELSPLPAAPDTKPNDLPPGPLQNQSVSAPPPQPDAKREQKPQPEKTTAKTAALDLPPASQAEQPVAVLPPPKPAEHPHESKRPQNHARFASAPSTAEREAARAAAPAPGATARNPDAVPNWKSRLIARIERYKRYPAEARAQGEQGIAQLAFSVDREGRVHGARILHSSGSSLLDRATLALIERAQPLPPPPPEIRGARIAVVVPIHYDIH